MLVLRLEEMKVSVPLCWWPLCLLILMDITTYLDFPLYLTFTSSLAWALRWFARSSRKCSLYKTSPTCQRTAFHSCPDQTSEQIPILLFIHSVVSSEKQNKAQPNQNRPVIKAKLSALQYSREKPCPSTSESFTICTALQTVPNSSKP